MTKAAPKASKEVTPIPSKKLRREVDLRGRDCSSVTGCVAGSERIIGDPVSGDIGEAFRRDGRELRGGFVDVAVTVLKSSCCGSLAGSTGVTRRSLGAGVMASSQCDTKSCIEG